MSGGGGGGGGGGARAGGRSRGLAASNGRIAGKFISKVILTSSGNIIIPGRPLMIVPEDGRIVTDFIPFSERQRLPGEAIPGARAIATAEDKPSETDNP